MTDRIPQPDEHLIDENDTQLQRIADDAGIEGTAMTLDPNGPPALVQYAIAQNATPDQLRDLLTIQREIEKDEARKAFEVAFANAKRNPPVIHKTRPVSIPGGASWKHAELDVAAKQISEWLGDHGMSFAWDIDDGGDSIAVSCRLKHIAGHSEAVTMRAPADGSGKKNPIQSRASTVTYLERYTLFAVCGLSATGDDNDGQSAPARQRPAADASKPTGRSRANRKTDTARDKVRALFARWRDVTGGADGDERAAFLAWSASAGGVETEAIGDPENWTGDTFERCGIRLDEIGEGIAE